MGLDHIAVIPTRVRGNRNANGVPKPDCEESVNSAEPEIPEYPGVSEVSHHGSFSERPTRPSDSPTWCHQNSEALTKMVRDLSAALERAERQPIQP